MRLSRAQASVGVIWATLGSALLGVAPGDAAAQDVWRLDCGTADSPVMAGYQRLTDGDRYDGGRGYGWESAAESLEFGRPQPDPQLRGSWGQLLLAEAYDNHRTEINRDAVVSPEDLVFRLDVPDGRYRVSVTIGDLSRALGSIDVFFNDELVGEHVAVWAPGGYRMLDRTPAGWWGVIRATVDSRDGSIRIALRKNQTYYDEQMAEQATWDNPYEQWYHRTPVIQDPPYFFIGYPFAHNSIMAIEVVPHAPPPVEWRDDQLTLTQPIDSPALGEAISRFNAGDFAGAGEALGRATEPEARVAAAIVRLWLAGRLETEIERTAVPTTAEVLRQHVAENPDDYATAEILGDAETFLKALDIHLTRGELGKNHFLENDRAIGWWWMLPEDSPLYWKAQLHIARAAHMLKPYMPTLGTERRIFDMLETKFPGNRFVKYHLHEEWENHGDGSDYYDWVMANYEEKAAGAPEWVRAIYPAYAGLVDLSEWWVKFRQLPEGTIGGGWGDDVEMVGLFGYYGYISRGVSDLCIQGTRNLVDGVWNLSEVDPSIGYCLPMADAEHSAEWTGNTLGMMVQIDYGNPIWIERSMMTGKLIRDLWTDYNDSGHRHFRANFLGASQVGGGDRMNDSWINYRAVSPASAVLRYNGNPAIAELYGELAEAWVAAAMSTARGKPEGVIPAQVSFPDGVGGGTNSPNWWTASHSPGTVNYDWQHQQYKGYLTDVLTLAYEQTGNAEFLEPLRLEYELAVKHGHGPDPGDAGARRARGAAGPAEGLEPGSGAWVAANLAGTEKWLEAERLIAGRQGALENTRTKAEIIESGSAVAEHLRRRWPLMTSEAGPTDRVGFQGIASPFFVYTGGSMGGPLLRAAVTYENTTKDFAAAVLGADPQGLRILYYSLAPETREVGIVPWELEAGGRYQLRVGVDEDEDDAIDRVESQREFVFPQRGSPAYVTVRPRVSTVIEIDQIERGGGPHLAPDPAVSTDDIRYEEERSLILARIHNVGSLPARGVKVAFYNGDPLAGGTEIGATTIPHVDAPTDLEPRTVTVGIGHRIEGDPVEIFVVVDPDDELPDEITSFNNIASARLPRAETEASEATARPASVPFRRGR